MFLSCLTYSNIASLRNYLDRQNVVLLWKIDRTKKEVQDLRADYTTLKANYMFASKQSEVAKRVKEIDLYESMEPPSKIEVVKGEY